MAILNPALVEGARMVVRQAVTSGTNTFLPTPSPSPVPSGSLGPGSITSSIGTTATSASPSATDTGASNGQPANNNPQQNSNSSPLLFFVALGFGVVFTNLWIIVGVKYCFRYNARNRAMRLNEDGEPINLENMPRPHRRRREKKLMTMEEVNEKFPMQKYKSWVAGRAQEGLPTRGGVTAPPSRSTSVRDVEGVVPELPSKERDSTEERPTTSTTSHAKPDDPAQDDKPEAGDQTKESTSAAVADTTSPAPPREPEDAATTTTAPPESEPQPQAETKARDSQDDEDDDDDEHINAALPPELMGTSGDTCAICIDTLEDDDDVRGLTCGHAFHAVCLDPWLTSRRACCPLCKADYYTPKPRPAVPEGGDPAAAAAPLNGGAAAAGGRINLPSRPGTAWSGFPARHFFPASYRRQVGGLDQSGQPPAAQSSSRFGLFGRSRLYEPPLPSSSTRGPVVTPTTAEPAVVVNDAPSSRGHRFADLRSALPPFRVGRRRNHQNPGDVADASGNIINGVSPSNLEAGLRPAESR